MIWFLKKIMWLLQGAKHYFSMVFELNAIYSIETIIYFDTREKYYIFLCLLQILCVFIDLIKCEVTEIILNLTNKRKLQYHSYRLPRQPTYLSKFTLANRANFMKCLTLALLWQSRRRAQISLDCVELKIILNKFAFKS